VFFVTAEAKDAVLVPVGALRPAGAGAGEDRRRGRETGQPRTPSRNGDTGAAADPRARLANGPAVVRVVAPGGALETREVRVGVVSRVSAQILSGLEPGEQVVVGQRAATPPATPRGASGNRSPMMGPRV
jgi:macrolide-specific efflux system membrane fusion protein